MVAVEVAAHCAVRRLAGQGVAVAGSAARHVSGVPEDLHNVGRNLKRHICMYML